MNDFTLILLSIPVFTRPIPHSRKSVLQEGQGLSHGSAVIEISSSALINNPTALKWSWEWEETERGKNTSDLFGIGGLEIFSQRNLLMGYNQEARSMQISVAFLESVSIVRGNGEICSFRVVSLPQMDY